ncbi:Mu transposase C-terminal domain-containing protein [Halocynthiibacter styelae]|uniref:Mu transposase C-terminal domain-containing protein n=1 Tax=Halocynthiibacter styelae TaxID=2761955 RepID=A0A8J7IDK0_9RHOB|nr:Mu transposase C-terminal domain-containing protein [Paenihalocynthiibacter styelae]MBI1494518.1 Mu transposase C-terminal domain-containing protein [Paenihalocynthiibacter styelae]
MPTLRHALGITLQRISGRHSILVCGINYHGHELDLHFKKFGGQELEVRVDPEDLSHVSVWLEDAWYTLPAMMDGVEGVPFALWESMMFDLRQSNRNATTIDQDMMDRAMARIRELDAEQRALRRLGPVQVSASDIRRAEHETFLGLKFSSGATTSISQDEELLSDTLSAIASAPAPHDPEVAQPETTFENRIFIDEDE